MKEYSFYDRETGLFAAGCFGTNDEASLALNTPAGHVAAEGRFDHLSQRVDVAATALAADGEGPVVVAYQPPAPPDDELRTWAWDGESKRWREQPTLEALRNAARAPLLAKLQEMDAALIRPAGEIAQAQALGEPVPAGALAKLQSLNGAKAVIRQQLAAITASQSPEELNSIDLTE